ncbi:UDP-N-acetyl glucosamine 2-epimerase [Bosea sp. Leaf344]|uniref:non-hydrolyzing UDP-N-acetylglucosamine 2-epimerase n=1 Tax=Bosea sp. Leaf344 TaxID=1736346 RepID=UPI0006F664C8|nr:UDP-N-acetylglucosamine 2-epimerase (non-hydrolyzing) [Bosea sp. Leaf344]KQU54818.1 UDP-N-acetyl glucosamine 2-epimerase [Bosea sp. Leaf344]
MSISKKRIVCVIGTRPEAIKMAPVIWELQRRNWTIVEVWITEQHRELLHPLLEFFELKADRNFEVMAPGQGLSGLNARILVGMGEALANSAPDLVIAQGDTTTVMAAAQSCFYAGVPFAHVEAGLRTGDLMQPFPEEFNRLVVSLISRFNFAPTWRAYNALCDEGISKEKILMTGNTVIDALFWTDRQNKKREISDDAGRKLLLTLHRRENFGVPIRSIFGAVLRLTEEFPDLSVLYPVHPNPNVRSIAYELLGNVSRIELTEPLDYPDMVAAMRAATVILTDSGGIQEEAPALGKPVFVARNSTERPESIEDGCAILVGSDADYIVESIGRVLRHSVHYQAMVKGRSPYGDGTASLQIVNALEAHFSNE